MRAAVRSARRLLGTTVVVCALGTLLSLLVARVVARTVSADRLAAVLRVAVPPSAVKACTQGDPQPAVLDAGVRFHFYDAHGRGLSAAAPPIDGRLLQRLRSGGDHAGRFDLSTVESRALLRLESAAPCAFAEARWRMDGRALMPFTAWVLGSILAVLVVLAMLVGLLVVRPLVAQLGALRRAADAVGTAVFPPLPAWHDEAGEIARALYSAHARILADAALLKERSATLAWLLAELTHDIRTPLSSLQFALDEIAAQASEEAFPALRRALSEVIYMKSLTDNLRLMHRIRGGEEGLAFRAEPVELGAVLGRVVERVRPFALRRGIVFEEDLQTSPTVLGDVTAIEQALTNLIENPVAHCEPGTRVLVALRGDASGARIVVEDDGPGVVPRELPRLGRPADRAPKVPGHDSKGRGLGLAIAREVCERSGWQICFQQVEPRGLRIIVDTSPRTSPDSLPLLGLPSPVQCK